MIIDLIQDRNDGQEYSPKKFYNDVVKYGEPGKEIAEALDGGEEHDIKRSLNVYIAKNEYSPLLSLYINSVNWL